MVFIREAEHHIQAVRRREQTRKHMAAVRETKIKIQADEIFNKITRSWTPSARLKSKSKKLYKVNITMSTWNLRARRKTKHQQVKGVHSTAGTSLSYARLEKIFKQFYDDTKVRSQGRSRWFKRQDLAGERPQQNRDRVICVRKEETRRERDCQNSSRREAARGLQNIAGPWFSFSCLPQKSTRIPHTQSAWKYKFRP